MAERLDITTPVGRLVGGSLYTPETTDYEGRPLLNKDGTPRNNFSFGIAIPKTPGVQHWAHEAWGAPIYALAAAAFPNGETQRHDFAWKIQDGDSQIPNKRGRKPCEREGYPGHWVMWFSSGIAPRIYNADGSQLITEQGAVKTGYYVQVFGNVTDNKPSQSPGLYINHTFVALAGYGPEIQTGPDVSAAGFGKGVQLPPGAMTTPPPATFTPAAPAPAAPAPAYVPPTSTPAAPAPIVAVAPNPGILNVPGTPAPVATPAAPAPAYVPPVAPVVPAAPVRQLTALAQGATYEQLIAAGWTDETLRTNGLML